MTKRIGDRSSGYNRSVKKARNCFADRFIHMLETRDFILTHMSKETGIHHSTFYDYMQKSVVPSTERIFYLAKIFNISPIYFTNLDDELQSSSLAHRIPVLTGELDPTSSQFVFNFGKTIDYEEIPLRDAINASYFGYQVTDTSLAPFISIDDVLIVKQQRSLSEGHLMLVYYQGKTYCRECKFIKPVKKNKILVTLSPYNTQEYDELTLLLNPKTYGKDFIVLGKVVENRQKY